MSPCKTKPGDKFGRLTVVERVGSDNAKNALWRCLCECGNTTTVPSSLLSSGNTKSCGCLKYESLKKANAAKEGMHGLSKLPNGRHRRLYAVWSAMKDRCSNPNTKAYRNYGGRGVTVCSEWMDYLPFHNWAISNGYHRTLTLDRIDVNGNYEPSNCRWITRREQCLNRRNTKRLAFNGDERTVMEWSEIFKIPYPTLCYRIDSGWDAETALTKPVRERRMKDEKEGTRNVR